MVAEKKSKWTRPHFREGTPVAQETNGYISKIITRNPMLVSSAIDYTNEGREVNNTGFSSLRRKDDFDSLKNFKASRKSINESDLPVGVKFRFDEGNTSVVGGSRFIRRLPDYHEGRANYTQWIEEDMGPRGLTDVDKQTLANVRSKGKSLPWQKG